MARLAQARATGSILSIFKARYKIDLSDMSREALRLPSPILASDSCQLTFRKAATMNHHPLAAVAVLVTWRRFSLQQEFSRPLQGCCNADFQDPLASCSSSNGAWIRSQKVDRYLNKLRNEICHTCYRSFRHRLPTVQLQYVESPLIGSIQHLLTAAYRITSGSGKPQYTGMPHTHGG